MPKAGGKRNVYEITVMGSTFTVMLNGQKPPAHRMTSCARTATRDRREAVFLFALSD
jgi:hypothetical protein